MVVSVLARLAFDFGVWSGGRIPITFVCEEAHRYVPIDKTPRLRADQTSRFRASPRKAANTACRCASITQRPAELDPTILSQCNTIFSMRLTNERDQEILRAGISDAAASLLEFMSTMGTGEAITFGEGVALPTRIKFDLLPEDDMPEEQYRLVHHELGQGPARRQLPQRDREPLAGPDLQSRQRRLYG